MTLTFPTMAEKALREFRDTTKTTSVAVVAKRMMADVERQRGRTVYTFDDDTRLVVTGRGRSHSIETELP